MNAANKALSGNGKVSLATCKIRAYFMLIAFFLLTAGCSAVSEADRITMLKEKADSGDARAQTEYGDALLFGRGVPGNSEEAFRYYMMAAKSGHHEAEYDVGNAYFSGVGTDKNLAEAEKWYRYSAIGGFTPAYTALASVLYMTMQSDKQVCEMFYWYKKAEQEDPKTLPLYYDEIKPKMIETCGE
jgi:hypothetical protein